MKITMKLSNRQIYTPQNRKKHPSIFTTPSLQVLSVKGKNTEFRFRNWGKKHDTIFLEA